MTFRYVRFNDDFEDGPTSVSSEDVASAGNLVDLSHERHRRGAYERLLKSTESFAKLGELYKDLERFEALLKEHGLGSE